MSDTKTGTVRRITEIEHVGAKQAPKRHLWLEHGDKYPQVSSFEFYGDKGVACLDGLNVGDTVTVHYDLRGREYTNKSTGQPGVFNSLAGWKVDRNSESPAGGNHDDDIPF